MKRGYVTRVSEKSGVPYETVRRYLAGGNVGIRSVKKIQAAEAEIKPKSKKPATAKAGA